ncbi:MAG: cysteine desulfurase [Planctomycetota bacterium]|nr:MAG: cysteine desulfurase [Planctomycetota bacterium]
MTTEASGTRSEVRAAATGGNGAAPPLAQAEPAGALPPAAPRAPAAAGPAWTAESIRADFPILAQRIGGRPLCYLDNAATAQKPRAVLEAVQRFYTRDNANIHRGIHTLAERATAAYEGVREQVRRFIHARSAAEIIFTRGTTESLNLVAHGWGRRHLRAGEEIVLTVMEHHSNLVPWQVVARATGARLRFVPLTPEGKLDLDALAVILAGGRARVLAFSGASNVLGTMPDVPAITRLAREHGVLTVLDAAQLMAHAPVDVQALGCDLLAFSGHKLGGPTGVGVLYGRREVLEEMDPLLTGGEMIRVVELESATWNDVPWRFEAGTMNIAQVVGLGAALEYLERLGMERVREHAIAITAYALDRLRERDVRVLGPPAAHERCGLVSFTSPHVHPHDLAQLLDQEGVAIRAGHHCAMPLHAALGIGASARASFFVYTSRADIDQFVEAYDRAVRFFAGA